MSSGRTGRRPGSPDTRAEILAAAKKAFIEQGYAEVSVRGIARRAGIDPALIHRWFGGKERLFLALLKIEFDPEDVMDEITRMGSVGLATRALNTITMVWDSPIGQTAVQAIKADPGLVPVVAGFMAPRISRLLTSYSSLTQQEARLRGAVLAAQYSGLVMMRYVGGVEPLASMPREDLVRFYAPIVHHIMFDPSLSSRKKSSP